ncbi:MAG: dihydroxy-acid dehydratase [Rhodobacterales bacterium]|nr:dihydroxy-acid dehydratase [Puniceibacterium antarcticum]
MMRGVLGVAVLACLWVAGCAAGVPNGGGTVRGFLENGAAPAPLKRAALAGGDIRLSGPAGYCIDPETLRVGSDQSFALLASCRILSGGASGGMVPPVLISVTVGALGSGGDVPEPQDLATAASEPMIEGRKGGGLSLALLGRGGDSMFDGGDARYWRGAFVQGGRLVSVALYVPQGSVILEGRGPEMLQALQAQVRADSPKQAPVGAEAGLARSKVTQ